MSKHIPRQIKGNVYKSLKPIVNDFSKPCRKVCCNKKENIEEIKLEFSETQVEDNELNEVDEIFKCGICLDLFNKPVSCYKCSKIFCGDCIQRRLQLYSKCPKCHNMIFFNLMPTLPDDYIEQYNHIIVQCPYEGCKDSFNLNEIKQHKELCVYKGRTRKENQRVNRIICQNKDDPYIKFPMIDYMRKLSYNSSLIKSKDIQDSLKVQVTSHHLKLQSNMSNLTGSVMNLIKELSMMKEDTNSQIKGLIYN